MAEVTINLPDGSSKQLPAGSTAGDLAASIGPRLAKAAIAAKINDQPVDLSTPLPHGADVAIVTATSPEGRHILRHSTAHVLAQAVTQLWPGAKFAIGPPIEDGFYYDFDLPGGAHFSDDDLVRIEERMREIVKEGQPFVREEHSREGGLELFKDQPYKVEIIEGVDSTEGAEGGVVSAYRNTDDFVDLCRGPHVPSTDRLGAFKLMRVAGPTGGATRRTSSCSGSTAPRGRPTPRSRSTCTGWRRPSAGTTASWAPSSTCSPSPTSWARAWPSSTPRAASSGG
jgi:threonyl-tRNA synthetase